MSILYILGSIGGIIMLIEFVHDRVLDFRIWYRKYRKMELYYQRHQQIANNVKAPMGFRTEKEEQELQDRLTWKGEP